MKEILKKLVNEIHLIEDNEVRDFTVSAIKLAPGDYWRRPSASTIGHHPDDEHGEWGNLIHVKRATRLAFDIAEASHYSQIKTDYLVAGMLIHDIGKYGVDGKAEKMVPEHPALVKVIITPLWVFDGLQVILGVALTHMGRWGDVPPRSGVEAAGHLADYLASRRYMEIIV